MTIKFRNAVIGSAVLASFVFLTAPVIAASFTQVKATWSGDGQEPAIKEFADIACVSKGYTSALNFDPTPASGAYEEDGNIISFMSFAKLECQ